MFNQYTIKQFFHYQRNHNYIVVYSTHMRVLIRQSPPHFRMKTIENIVQSALSGKGATLAAKCANEQWQRNANFLLNFVICGLQDKISVSLLNFDNSLLYYNNFCGNVSTARNTRYNKLAENCRAFFFRTAPVNRQQEFSCFV